jgi:TRAP-type C4-dicarboxylate transport system substrate-binding protein
MACTRKLAGALSLAAVLALSAMPSAAATVLRVAHWLPARHPLFTEVIEPWTKEVTKVTQGRVVMQVLGAPLGPPAAHFDFVANGIVDVAYGVHNYTPGRFTAPLLAELPFQCEKSEYLSVAYWRIHQQYLAKANEHRGTKLLTVFTHGPGQLWTQGRDVSSMSALKGAKIRVAGGFSQEAAKGLGLVPIQAPVTDTYQMLSGKVVDGIEFPSESITSFKVESVLDRGLLVPGGLYTVSLFLVMNQAKWQALSKQDQEAIMSISGETLARNAGKFWDRADATALRDIASRGRIKLVTPSAAQMTAIRTALEPYRVQALQQITAKGINAQDAYQALQREIARTKAGT